MSARTPRAAVSLYVAIALHAVVFLGMLSGGFSPEPAGQGITVRMDAVGLHEQDRWLASAPPPLANIAASMSTAQRPAPARAEKNDAVGQDAASAPRTRLKLAASKNASAPEAKAQAAKPVAEGQRQSAASTPRTIPAPAPAPTVLGGGVSASKDYLSRLRRHLARHRNALPAGLGRARTLVSFVLAADGSVSQPRLVESSGIDLLDREALSLIQRAAPLPEPPSQMVGEILVPIILTP